MISPESFVFKKIAEELRVSYPGIYVTGEVNQSPAKFPAVSIVEADNSVYRRLSAGRIENAVSVMYEINVYSNLIGYGKSEAKEIMSTIDHAFSEMGFTRMMCNPIENLQDGSIYRIAARYEGVDHPEYTEDGLGGFIINHRIYTK